MSPTENAPAPDPATEPTIPATEPTITTQTLQKASKIVKLNTLINHPKNARRGDIASVKASLTEHGQYKPLIVQKSTMHVLAGNHTLIAMRELEWPDGVAVILDVDDAEALRILAVDNRTSDLATYDDNQLLTVLKELADTDTGLTGTGYTEEDLTELRRLTGDLGREQGSFLDDLREPNQTRRDTSGRNHFQLIFPCSQEQRDLVNAALRKVQSDRELSTSVEALIALAQDILK